MVDFTNLVLHVNNLCWGYNRASGRDRFKIQKDIEGILKEIIDNSNSIYIVSFKTLKSCNIHLHRLERINPKIVNLAKAKAIITQECQEMERALELALLFDMDSIDHNNSIAKSLQSILEKKIPVITTRTLFNRSMFLDRDKYDEVQCEKILFLKGANEWHIFTVAIENGQSDFLLFLPKSTKQSLNDLGFARENLIPTSILEILEGPKSARPLLSEFYAFFSDTLISKKIIYLDGHGDDSCSAGLKSTDMDSLLNFFNRQRVTSVFISACSAGGSFSNNYLTNEVSKLSYQEPTYKPHLSFPIILYSIGSYVTYGNFDEIQSYFNTMQESLAKGRGFSIMGIRKLMAKFGNASYIPFVHHQQVLLPYSRMSAGGFRTGQSKDETLLTSTKIQCVKLSANPTITINTKLVELYALHILVPVILRSTYIRVISMVQGPSHHLFSELSIESGTLLKWIQYNEKRVYQREDASKSAEKAIFIKHFSSKNENYEGLAIDFSCQMTSWLYQKQGKYYYATTTDEVEISKAEYACELVLLFQRTQPIAKAIRAATGGQETGEELYKTLYRDFIKDPFLVKFLESDYKPESFELLSQEEKQALLTIAVFDNSPVALELLEDHDIDVKKPTRRGYHLFFKAVEIGNLKLAQKLYEKGADINAKEPHTEFTALMNAVLNQQDGMIDFLLQCPELDPTMVESGGENVLHFSKIEYLAKFLAHPRKFDLNQKTKTGFTALSIAVNAGNLKKAEALLNLSVNIEAGKTSPLVEAIRNRDLKMVKLLLSRKAACQLDESGQSPLVEAILRSTLDIIELLIENTHDLNQKDKFGGNPLLAAGLQGNRELFIRLSRRGCTLPANSSQIELIWHIALIENDEELFEELVKHLNPKLGSDSRIALGTSLIEEIVKLDRSNMIVILAKHNKLISNAQVLFNAYWEKKYEMIRLLLINGFQSTQRTHLAASLLKRAVQDGDIELIKQCLDLDQKLDTWEKLKPCYLEALMRNNSETVALLRMKIQKENWQEQAALISDTDIDNYKISQKMSFGRRSRATID